MAKRPNNIVNINDEIVESYDAPRAKYERRVYKRRHRRVIIVMAVAFVLGVLAVGLQVPKLHEAQASVRQQQKVLAKVKKENAQLKQEKQNLKDDDYVEKLIRQRYMYTKNGETVFNITDSSSD
ncbi:FtsB family cell division protein [Weissella soli]|jgi:cell division protein DivIC|uniref:Cell division protein DivIC n=1 Tax=Weissella soli TaxID=155866 RepID=A0A288QYY3_9LACO|nr:septum formation initiator family protein [Weissella soli]AOT57051.1 hypothetical protein WSWS_01468 [Weissella soli]MCT8395705.1 septum formation initiator family protein [Weissella soli]NKY83977.1 septum formation initiator family protein [Weissella soli]QEA35524.1 septum formation initiator family protein [Weissella soli]RDL01061.1 cell division protein DivIC [Weissella soli]